jgi:hypothetical protein
MVTEQWVFAMYGYLHALRKASLVMLSVLDQAKHCSENQKAQCQPKSSEIKIPNQLSRIHYYGNYFGFIIKIVSSS